MTFIYHFLAYILTLPLLIIWLLFCALISFIGAFLPKVQIAINLKRVKKSDTICSVLNKKGLLSDKEYNFETNDVANKYDELTFNGYLFVLNPVIILVKNSDFTNKFILYLVHKWMLAHNYKEEEKKSIFFSSLFKFCVLLAEYVGRFLHFLKA